MREPICISLPHNLKAELDRYSEAEGVRRSAVICAALREYLFGRNLRDLRRRLLP